MVSQNRQRSNVRYGPTEQKCFALGLMAIQEALSAIEDDGDIQDVLVGLGIFLSPDQHLACGGIPPWPVLARQGERPDEVVV
jgi:hypothetical protein